MKLLVVSHAGLQANSPRARRWRSVVESLVEAGYDVTVVQAPSGNASPIMAGPGRVEVHEVQGLGGSLANPVALDGATHSAGQPLGRGPSRVERFGHAINAMLRSLVRQVRWPDFAFPWIVPAAVRGIRLQRANDFAALISVSHPFSSHLVGLCLKLWWPKLPWLLDIGDPFSFLDATPPNNFALYRRLNHWVENRCLSLADGVSVTCDGTRRMFEATFPVCTGKTRVIGPLYRPQAAMPFMFEQTDQTRAVVRVLFAGTLYASIRKPSGAIDFFRECAALVPHVTWELHFVGQRVGADAIPSRGRCGNVEYTFHEFRSGEAALGMMRAADCLLNISNDTWYQLPSKLIDYMALGKPILNLSTVPDDESSSFLRAYSSGLTVVFSGRIEESDRDRVVRFFQTLREVPEAERTRVQQVHSAGAIGAQYCDWVARDTKST